MIRLGAAVSQCVFSSNSLFGLMCVFGSSVRMQVCFLLLLIQLHVTEGCTLNRQTVTVTGYVGESVLLPCSCSELQAKPHTFRWVYFKGSDRKEIFPKDETNRYTDRVQIFKDHLPGNLSLLITHLTVEDGGVYRCKISNTSDTNINLTVKVPHTIIIIIICTAVGVLLLLLILGGVMYWKHRGQRRGQTETGDGQTGQRIQQKKQNDCDVLYTAINPQTKRNKAEEKDDVTYSTVVHSNTVRAAHTPVASGDTAVYAIIKIN
ncbi:uncharacterized protein LOC108254905 [Ictalurus punctatus]|uniref:Uncharacterized protein LOC108254905 n=1 Tax=Ictalurus punctatus TaxID=7998 RepID=A0A2D0PIY1_ICTPU|nr:uncharacterized protein LOC108254905 [Ictalurus punctatus]